MTNSFGIASSAAIRMNLRISILKKNLKQALLAILLKLHLKLKAARKKKKLASLAQKA